MKDETQKLSPGELEFLAEQTMITILPNFEDKKVNFLTGDFGPFTPGLPVDVPLWIALTLKQRNKCKIHPPEWLDEEKLQDIKEAEVNDASFSEPPSRYYMEISSMLFIHAASDIPKADVLRTLIKDIWDIRVAKLRKSVDHMVQSQETHAEINNLTLMEMNHVRPLLLPSLNRIHEMRCYVAQVPAPGS